MDHRHTKSYISKGYGSCNDLTTLVAKYYGITNSVNSLNIFPYAYGWEVKFDDPNVKVLQFFYNRNSKK